MSHPPDRSPHFIAKSFSDSLWVEAEKGQTERRKRSRNFSRGTVKVIQRTAQERQEAWLETGQPNRTYQLTRELDVLYDEHRDEQADTFTDPFCGRTWRAH